MLTLDDLTVGDVSGVIAAAITITHMAIILAAPFIMIAIFHRANPTSTASAVTWSVVGRFLHSSWWSELLRADSASTRGVPSYIVTIGRLKTALMFLTSVASIVTPLGLYQAITPRSKASTPSFHYVRDPGDFGLGTVPRSNLPFSRICGAYTPVACPNSFSQVSYVENATGWYSDVTSYDSRVPQYVIDAFESGLSEMNESVSSIFDIQSRSYTWGTINDLGFQPDNNASYPVEFYRQISTMVTENKVLLVEGLIVDMVNGGIGFRNHSAPPVTPYGSVWSEDILFIEPESSCVDLNLTIDFTLPKYTSQGDSVYNAVLTDRGGFVNLNRTYPFWESWDDRQNDQNLQFRAYKAAWLNNVYSMAFMNVTSIHNDSIPGSSAFAYLNSELGKTFPLMYSDSSSAPALVGGSGGGFSPEHLYTSTLYGEYLAGLDQEVPGYNNTDLNITSPSKPPLYSNPFGINSTLLSDIGVLCTGAGGQDLANITNTIAQCGLMYGAPRRQDNGISLLFEPGSNWTIPLYSCVSTAKATIKTVYFRFNGSDDLSGVAVTDIQDKVYADDAHKPLWGVEQTNLTLSDVSPLWGLISSSYNGNISLSTVRKESLYLPGYSGWSPEVPTSPSFQNLPGTSFYNAAIGTALNIGFSSGFGVADYSGQTNSAMLRQWQDLSQSAATSARILNLVWTDVAANAVIGTRTLAPQKSLAKRGNNNSNGSDSLFPSVVSYKRRVQYHYPYGIPAFLTLLFTVALILASLAAALLGHSGPRTMRRLLNKTSLGRVLTPLQVHKSEAQHARGLSETPGTSELVVAAAPTKQWRETLGKTTITLTESETDFGPTEPVYHPVPKSK